MRILFTFAGGSGHLEPLVPIARAAAAAGHAVAFCGRPWMTPQVTALALPMLAAGSDTGLRPQQRPLVAPDIEHERRIVGTAFAGRVARERAVDLLPLVHAWQPDLLVCEEVDFGAMVVAEHCGLPFANVVVIAAGSFIKPEYVAPPLDALRAAYGLPPDPALAMLTRHLVLAPFPPQYRDPADPLPPAAYAFRPPLRSGAAAKELAGIVRRPDWPTIYFTLGTVFPLESGDLFRRVLAGLRGLQVNVITTVGREFDPADLGPQPAQIHVARYIPQASLLAHSDLVINHGGSGSVLGALAHGRPLLVLPLGADQPLNAARCSGLGAGLTLDAVNATPAMIGAAVTELLQAPKYRRAAMRIRNEIAALPAAETTVGLIERIARPGAAG